MGIDLIKVLSLAFIRSPIIVHREDLDFHLLETVIGGLQIKEEVLSHDGGCLFQSPLKKKTKENGHVHKDHTCDFDESFFKLKCFSQR